MPRVIDHRWVLLAAALGLVGSLRYAVATLRGRARPNRVTFALWAAAPLIAFAAQLDDGVGAPAVLTLASGTGPLVVLASSFLSRHGAVVVTAFDLACGAISVAALAIWLGRDDPTTAVVVAVVADAAGAVPTVRKAWRDPASENAGFYVLVGLGAAITLLTVTTTAPAAWVFAAYVLAVTALLTTIIAARRGRAVAGRAG